MTTLDKLETLIGLKGDPEFNIDVTIHCSRTRFNELWQEITDEYDLSIADDIKVTEEHIQNQLSNIYAIMLHGQKYLFHIKD